MTMLIRRLESLPILYLLIISLLISPAVTSGYVWSVSADKHSILKEAGAGDCASDNYVANVMYRWEYSHARQVHQPDSFFASISAATASAHFPLTERKLKTHQFVHASPRISDQILHHRTIVLLI